VSRDYFVTLRQSAPGEEGEVMERFGWQRSKMDLDCAPDTKPANFIPALSPLINPLRELQFISYAAGKKRKDPLEVRPGTQPSCHAPLSLFCSVVKRLRFEAERMV
jgi:hypothetical protein